MDAKKKRNYYQPTAYIDGSTVRKLNTVPEIRREREEIRQPQPKKVPKAKPRRKPAIGLFSFVILTAAMGITLYSAVDYLKVLTQITDLSKSISSSEVQLAELTADNDAALSKINASLDLEDIFNKAVNDLGMVFPNKNQVITYEAAVSEYVRQYDTVPEANAEDLLEKLFK